MSERDAVPSNIIFGIHPVREALQAPSNRVEKVFISEGRRDTRIGQVLDLARSKHVPIQRLSSPLFHRMFGSKGMQSLAAQVASVGYTDADDLAAVESGLFLVLDEIVDPRNLGSIFRSALAANATGVFLPTRRTAPISPIVEKASAGAISHIRTARVVNLTDLIRSLNERSIQTIALVPGAPCSYLDCDLTLPTAFVLGGEEKGVRRLVRESCTWIASIPMAGPVRSLNVSVAAAVVLYEALRQRRAAAVGKG